MKSRVTIGSVSIGYLEGKRMSRHLLLLLLVCTFFFSASCGVKENVVEEESLFSGPPNPVSTFSCGDLKSGDLLGNTAHPIITHYRHIASCEQGLGLLVTAGMRWKTGVDIAFINAGSIRRRDTDEFTYWDIGPITYDDLVLVFPFDNPTQTYPTSIVTVDVTGAVIKEALENSFSRMFSNGDAGTSYGRFLQVSGIVFHADVTKAIGERITSAKVETTDETIDLSDNTKTYKVAIPSKFVKDQEGMADYDEYWDIFAKGSNVSDSGVSVFCATAEVIWIYFPDDGFRNQQIPTDDPPGYCDTGTEFITITMEK